MSALGAPLKPPPQQQQLLLLKQQQQQQQQRAPAAPKGTAAAAAANGDGHEAPTAKALQGPPHLEAGEGTKLYGFFLSCCWQQKLPNGHSLSLICSSENGCVAALFQFEAESYSGQPAATRM
ncbi:hypothetical protein ETH_00043865 [Eimeria tenella]|uniref:Uncharacterized protein n=1 Tax=Eimeria tenella TaxID=5802 RepID=U6KKH5_EIMTE|nr:hypothetical protein ETH_00043865 [Eimeria tenella]CDJ38404.1 hypothetical protein ETH_00043865 [Eimeria tenella]|eukprot:XP_013229242.1 hypothetical protein ETH_00043865 [Eimeria tenella]